MAGVFGGFMCFNKDTPVAKFPVLGCGGQGWQDGQGKSKAMAAHGDSEKIGLLKRTSLEK